VDVFKPANQTPNLILNTTDIPDNARQWPLSPETSYPSRVRYSLQWLIAGKGNNLSMFRDNGDASFKSHLKQKPSDTLLHYNYGAAAVKRWGKNIAVLGNGEGLLRPQKPEVLPVGPTRGVGNRKTTINKLARARAGAGQVRSADNGDGPGSAALADSELSIQDEDDLMLFFWGNSKASVERHAKGKCEREQSINEWRKGTIA
jgi:hypothetical protein